MPLHKIQDSKGKARKILTQKRKTEKQSPEVYQQHLAREKMGCPEIEQRGSMLIFTHQLAPVPSRVKALSFPWETGKHICSFPRAGITYIPNKSFLKIPLSKITFHHVLASQMEKESEGSPREREGKREAVFAAWFESDLNHFEYVWNSLSS